jgi:uncharacterized UBP type Zn finger protein
MMTCTHLNQMREVTPSADGCEDCLRTGDSWVHLRLCMICGHVGCCDQSKNKHATKHFHSTGHPIIRSFEPREDWGWCYVDELDFDATNWPVRGPVAHSV